MLITLPLFPDYAISIHVFSDVQNAPEILTCLKNADPSYNYCFLDARRICSIEQVLFALMRALQDSEAGQMRTKTLYSEIVYSMSPNQNISEALKRFGIAEDTTALVCLAINTTIDETLIEGVSADVTNETLMKYCNLSLLKAIYKIDKSLEDIAEIRTQVVTSIAMRGHL